MSDDNFDDKVFLYLPAEVVQDVASTCSVPEGLVQFNRLPLLVCLPANAAVRR